MHQPLMQAALALDKSTYSSGERAVITTTVTDVAGPVGGAAVRLELTTARGSRLEAVGRTGADGIASLIYNVDAMRDGTGLYNVDARADVDGFEPGYDRITFRVNDAADH